MRKFELEEQNRYLRSQISELKNKIKEFESLENKIDELSNREEDVLVPSNKLLNIIIKMRYLLLSKERISKELMLYFLERFEEKIKKLREENK